mmetsp:Transcript_32482/g.75862  ORF Transcript_32482/g.75862 Transcript_32482/m.75862 type:complete len:106 (-) Transcript_32482:290-607(-)
MGNLCNPPKPEESTPIIVAPPVVKPAAAKQLTRPSMKATIEWEKRTGKRYICATPPDLTASGDPPFAHMRTTPTRGACSRELRAAWTLPCSRQVQEALAGGAGRC